jgi:pSer/pThr/pTyr-binding forkhead associated (FHA) protein
VLAAGKSRREIARTLNAAYANGLLSEDTFLHRVDQLRGAAIIETTRFVGDQDLESTNGTTVNGEQVGRSELRAGDVISIGTQRLTID